MSNKLNKDCYKSDWDVLDFLKVYPEYQPLFFGIIVACPKTKVVSYIDSSGSLRKVELHLADDYIIQELQPIKH